MFAPLLITFVTVFSLLTSTNAHARWKCPQPRDVLSEDGTHITFDNTGNKYGSCGPESGKWGFGTVNSSDCTNPFNFCILSAKHWAYKFLIVFQVSTLKSGWNTITWEESISHTGSPFRISLLDERESQTVVLLDHIPHNEASKPTAYVEGTYVPYKMSIFVPDISCEKCVLQMLYVMTDKSTVCGIETCYYNPQDAACKGSTDPDAETCYGAPNDIPCKQEGECYSNYHSCSDVTITGSLPLTSFAMDSQPSNWPYKNMTMNYYGAEIGAWSSEGWLQNVPVEYTTDYGGFEC